MSEKSPFFTASVASLVYFVTFIALKFFLQGKTADLSGALAGAVIFWIVIFLVHKILERRKIE
ncbi:MAG: hypothetical protein FIB08_00550 [Candidatus Methanoperedens sp.]|nr:hypothetical protein [Candidatus Methanoperedens sp.]